MVTTITSRFECEILSKTAIAKSFSMQYNLNLNCFKSLVMTETTKLEHSGFTR